MGRTMSEAKKNNTSFSCFTNLWPWVHLKKSILLLSPVIFKESVSFMSYYNLAQNNALLRRYPIEMIILSG